jgi:hypothetical protein
MFPRCSRLAFVLVGVLSLSDTPRAIARTILNFAVGGFNSPSLATPAPNNDNATASNPNNIPLPGTPGSGLTFISTDPIEPKDVANNGHQPERPKHPGEIAAAAKDADAPQERDGDDVQLKSNRVVRPGV